jgi:hypothetical protein
MKPAYAPRNALDTPAVKPAAPRPGTAPGVPLFLQRQPDTLISGPARVPYPSKGWLPPNHQTGTQFDATLLQTDPALLLSVGGTSFVHTAGKTNLLIALKLAITWQDFDRNFVDSQGKKPYRNLRLSRARRAAGKWTEAEKTAYRQNLRAAIESTWSGKHDFILKDDTLAAINRARVCVRVDLHDAPAPAHYRVTARKLPPAIKPEQEIRSWVAQSEHTSVLDSTDEDPHAFTQMSGSAYLRRVGPFAQGSADITPELDTQINTIAGDIHPRYPKNLPPDMPEPGVEFTGRASAEGGTQANRELGEKRAENVKTKVTDRLRTLGTPVDFTLSRSHGEQNASTDPVFRRVDVYFNPRDNRTGTRTTAAHEAGHMFGLDDEYVEEPAPYKRFAGDVPEHSAKVEALMGAAAAEELRAQDSDSIMSRGDVVRTGHYVFFLEALNALSGNSWQVAPPSASPCQPTARTP